MLKDGALLAEIGETKRMGFASRGLVVAKYFNLSKLESFFDHAARI